MRVKANIKLLKTIYSSIQKCTFRSLHFFFLHALNYDLFSLFAGIILSTNLLTELDIDRIGGI